MMFDIQLLAARETGTFVSNRVIHLALSFLTTGVSHAHVWKVIKPHFLVSFYLSFLQTYPSMDAYGANYQL